MSNAASILTAVPIDSKKVNFVEISLTLLSYFLTFVPILALAYLVYQITLHGSKVVTWEFISAAPSGGMMEGGIFPCIFGTLAVTILMILMALPLGIGAAIYLVEYGGGSPFVRVVRAAVNNLAGVPSIVFGLFGVGFFVLFIGRNLDNVLRSGLLFGQPCMLWAAATLSVLVLPVIIVSTEEALMAVPEGHRSASLALGATKWQTIRDVVLPQARGGILTGAILAISRGAGETAPILFTGCAYFLPRLPVTNLFGVIPMVNPLNQFMELSYHIFAMATQSHDTQASLPIQYGTTLVLITLTFILNFSAIILRGYFRKKFSRASLS